MAEEQSSPVRSPEKAPRVRPKGSLALSADRGSHPETHTPPSHPTVRSRRVRDGILVAAALLWAGAMYAVRRESVAGLLATNDEPKGVFAESFEPSLKFGFRVKDAPVLGRGERLTEEPYEGRRIVRHRGLAEATVLGQTLEIKFDFRERWDVNTGFVVAEVKVLVSLPGMPAVSLSGTATREGAFLVTTVEMAGGKPERKVMPFPEEAAVSVGILEPARAEELAVGVKWTEQTVGLPTELGGSSVHVSSSEVEVVEGTSVRIGGRDVPAFLALARMETAAKRFREYRRWYDLSGRCLRQEVPFVVATLDIERELAPAGRTFKGGGPAPAGRAFEGRGLAPEGDADP